MKPGAPSTRDRTRRAILEAVADVIMESHGVGFSVQAVADRAGVTHRTVYNHFPTRDALCEAFADYVDESLASTSQPFDGRLTRERLPDQAASLYQLLQLRERNVRAGVMLMIGTRRPTRTWEERTRTIESLIAANPALGAPPPRQAAAAVRLFASSIGWHLLTEQCGLSTDEAAATTAWASRVLLDASTTAGATAARPSSKAKRHATRRRRR
ncbi:MAG: TetR/AcrR family transcriptional regulator [Vicinamibacterales bacterium]